MAVPPLRSGLEDGAIVGLRREASRVIDISGRTLARPDVGVRLRYLDLGTLDLGGRLVVGDPYAMSDRQAFARRVPAGLHRVFAVLAETKAGAARCAFGGVQFADTSATRFMPARFQDEPPWRVRPDSVGGTGTDSATIGLVTARDHHVFKGDDEHLFTDLDKQIDEVPEKAGGIIRLENKNGTARLAVWRSGFGDGMYTTYWGSTGLNRLVSLVVDFGVIENGLRGPVVPRDKVGETIEYQADHDAAEA